jgi:DNA polymerase V
MRKGDATSGVLYHAGFPNAGEDRQGLAVSLDALAIRHRVSTYLWRLPVEGIPELGWQGGSVVVVDRALSPRENDLLVALIDEDFVVRRFRGKQLYRPDSERETAEQASVWGVITHVLQEYRSV